jgi:excisionase family DNA binding protein
VDRIVIPLGNGDWIAVTAAEFAEHKAAAAALGFGQSSLHRSDVAEPLCTAEELAKALHVPKTRIEQATREGKIPSVRVGRYHRYRRSEAEAAFAKATKQSTLA